MSSERAWLSLAGALVLCASCATVQPAPGPALPDLEGQVHEPLQPAGSRANVLIFTTTDCPIANGYAPEISALALEYGPQGMSFFLVHVDPDVTPEAARAHARDYSLDLTILLDSQHQLVAATGATVTPEAVVIAADGELLYRGRIDNLYADLGVKRRQPTKRDLREILSAIAAGNPVETEWAEAVGCFIPEL